MSPVFKNMILLVASTTLYEVVKKSDVHVLTYSLLIDASIHILHDTTVEGTENVVTNHKYPQHLNFVVISIRIIQHIIFKLDINDINSSKLVTTKIWCILK